jgi:hypothetical protein
MRSLGYERGILRNFKDLAGAKGNQKEPIGVPWYFLCDLDRPCDANLFFTKDRGSEGSVLNAFMIAFSITICNTTCIWYKGTSGRNSLNKAGTNAL